jgi:hypothetical protein
MYDTQDGTHAMQAIFPDRLAIFTDRLATQVGPFSPSVRSDAAGHIFVSLQVAQSANTGSGAR